MLLRKRIGSLAATTVLTMALTACADRGDHGNLKTILSDLRQATVPRAATELQTSPVEKTRPAATAVWSFRVPMQRNTYRGWVLANIDGHQVSCDTDTLLVVSRRVPGDVHRLEIRMTGGSPLGVQVSFRGMPD